MAMFYDTDGRAYLKDQDGWWFCPPGKPKRGPFPTEAAARVAALTPPPASLLDRLAALWGRLRAAVS